MQVKKFEAPTIQEALDAIKRELGPEAIILQTKKNKKGFGLLSKASVEVTAAISERAIQKKEAARKRVPPEIFERIEKLPSSRQAEIYEKSMEKHLRSAVGEAKDRVEFASKRGKRSSGETSKVVSEVRYAEIDADAVARERSAGEVRRSRETTVAPPLVKPSPHFERELSELRQLVQKMMGQKAAGQGPSSEALEPVRSAFELLVLAGVDRRVAHSLVTKARFELGPRAADPETLLDHVAEELMATTETLSWLSGNGANGQRILALVGPTGVGKTTTLAKIASEAILQRRMKVGLINLDSYKVAAFDQLATYAKILKAPFRSAASSEDLKAAIADFSSLDLILIDTTGRSQKDPDSLREMRQVLEGIESGVETALVLSATTRDAELYDCASRFSLFNPRGLIFSKLDEATTFGCIYNTSLRAKLPLLYFATGQRVPEDLEESTPERLTALILDL